MARHRVPSEAIVKGWLKGMGSLDPDHIIAEAFSKDIGPGDDIVGSERRGFRWGTTHR